MTSVWQVKMGFKCSCGIIFNEVYALSRHIQFKHYVEENGKLTFSCSSANCKPFAGANHIVDHFVNNHLDDNGMEFLAEYLEERSR